MIRSLTIRNYALIEDVGVEFGPGLNVLTGETGAGKSILIGALGLVLGERADATAVRTGAAKTVIEAEFSLPQGGPLGELLAEAGIEAGEDLIVRREVSAKGQSRSFLNDTPVTLALLKQAGEFLVDLHGQHEHQSLLREAFHLRMIDDYGKLGALVTDFRRAKKGWDEIREALEALRSKEAQLRERRDLYEFQLREIDNVGPRPGEEEELEGELKILENAETLFSATERLYRMLHDGGETGAGGNGEGGGPAAVHEQLVLLRNELENLSKIDPAFHTPAAEAASAAAVIDELAKFLQQYSSRIDFNPDRLEEIRNRLGALALLRKKYGGSLETVIEQRGKVAAELALAENFDGEIARLENSLAAQVEICSSAAGRLSQKRREAASRIASAVAAEMQTLGMPNGRFDVSFSTREIEAGTGCVRIGRKWFAARDQGVDEAAFIVRANAGEELRPLASVASGGEISRIMLSLKMVLAKTDRLPLLVFDEIDSGISGRIARTVGLAMKKLAQFHQIIAITHLPQIAGCADAHYVVEKSESATASHAKTTTSVRLLDADERVTETARLLSGEEVTGAARRSARELIGTPDG